MIDYLKGRKWGWRLLAALNILASPVILLYVAALNSPKLFRMCVRDYGELFAVLRTGKAPY